MAAPFSGEAASSGAADTGSVSGSLRAGAANAGEECGHRGGRASGASDVARGKGACRGLRGISLLSVSPPGGARREDGIEREEWG